MNQFETKLSSVMTDEPVSMTGLDIFQAVESRRPDSGMRPVEPRRAGVLQHITSLPGASDMGDLGQRSYQFVD